MTAAPILSANLRGAGWILLSSIAFVLMTTLVKITGHGYSAGTQAFYRQFAGVIVLLPAIVARGRSLLRVDRLPLMLFRSAAQSLGFILSFWSFELLPLADANAFSFTRVLWVVPLAVLFLRERTTRIQLAATVLGFGGVLVMLRPTQMGSPLGPLVALAAALLIACANVSVKALARDHDNIVLLIWSSVLGAILTAPFLASDLRVPAAGDLLLLAAMGALGVAAQYFFVQGMRIGEASVIAPVDYSRLLFAAAIGVFGFGEPLQRSTVAGAAIIVAAGLALALRGYRDRRAARAG